MKVRRLLRPDLYTPDWKHFVLFHLGLSSHCLKHGVKLRLQGKEEGIVCPVCSNEPVPNEIQVPKV
jgi:hypothetical protein